MSYRPITDVWILSRAKLKNGRKYYGAYPGGFPERARKLLGATINEPVLHVCGGMAKNYPYPGGFGPNDGTLDTVVECHPDYLQDAKCAFPKLFKAYLIDPPYTQEDHNLYVNKYACTSDMPRANELIKNGIDALDVGGRVGLLHYIWPSPPKNAKCIAAITVLVGYNNRARLYTVYEKIS